MKFKNIGTDVQIHPSAQITRPQLIQIGNHVSIDMGVYISVAAKIGDYIHIAPQSSIIGGKDALLIMKNFISIASGSRVICASDDFTNGLISPIISTEYKHIINEPIIFKNFSSIGVNCVIMPGITLAKGSVLGANSLLTKNTIPWGIYVGSPAKLVSKRKSELILKSARRLGYDG